MINNKWFGFMVAVWVVGILLGSSFEGHGASAQGLDYITGTAAFTTGSTTVVGSGTTWVTDMEGGIIMYDADGSYFRIREVDDATHLTLICIYPYDGGSGTYTMKENPEWMGESEETTLEYLLNPKNIVVGEDEIGWVTWWIAPFEYFRAWFKVIMWDFQFLDNTMGDLVRWIVLVPFSIAVVAGLIILFVQLLQGFVNL